MNKLVAYLEEGHLHYESHTGDWLSGDGIDYLTSVFDDEVRPGLETELEDLPEEGVYLITINSPYWVSDGGYWDMNYGYVAPESHLEWEGLVTIERIDE